MQNLKDQLPRIFQANLQRFYGRVVHPAMDALPAPVRLAFGETETLDVFLQNCAVQVDNYTANEAAKAFTLILSALFERQLRQWAFHLFPQPRTPDVQTQKFRPLLDDCLEKAGIDGNIEGMRHGLVEAFLVANVVRHGDGRSCTELQAVAPELWVYDQAEYVDINAGPSPESEKVRIRPNDVRRYTRAGMLFWGWADPDPLAVRGKPFF